MLCQRCNKNEASVKYTEIINGKKKEMMLCEECSHELGLDNIDFNMPIDFASFFGSLLEEEAYNTSEIMPLFRSVKELKCDNCNMTYEDFINQGKFGCPDCYDTFSSKIDSLLKRIHGSTEYLGRKALNSTIKHVENEASNGKDISTKNKNNKICKLEELKQSLKKAVSEERYEDAARIRDEIKKIEK